MNAALPAVFLISAAAISTGLSQTAPAPTSPAKPVEISQNGTNIHLVVTSPRPLMETLNALHTNYGWSLNYEDPQFVSQLDLVEASDPRYLVSRVGPTPHIPNGGAFSADFPAGGGPASTDVEKTLRMVVDSYNQSKNPGQFEIRRAVESFDVVGIAAHDEAGHISPQKALLDFSVTLPVRERSASDTVDLICKEVAKISHVKVVVGIQPRGLMLSRMVSTGGKKLAARELLRNTLSATGRKLNWQLLYDADSKNYILNLYLTPK